MDNRAIGVFDSGLGGLTAVREIQKILPNERIIYFGDTSRVPYGGRSREILQKYAQQDVHFLRTFDIKAIVVACGTISTTALPQIQQENDLLVMGVVKPVCKKACRVTTNKKIGMIATNASVNSGTYEKEIAAIDKEIQVFSKACPLFVPMVENGRFSVGDIAIETIAKDYLLPLKEKGIDTLILGCTHYPLLTDVIASVMGPEVQLINSGAEVAYQLKEELTRADALSDGVGETVLYASDLNDDFSRLASCFLQEKIEKVLSVDIDKY